MGQRSLLAALLFAACVLPFILPSYMVFQLTMVLAYALALLGLNLLVGFNGQISLGHGAFFALGAYVAAMLMEHAGWPYWATLPAAAVVGGVLGYLFKYTSKQKIKVNLLIFLTPYIIHDQTDKMLYFENAQLEFFGVPMAYLPYFSTPDPTVKRKTGFLMPSYNSATGYGFGRQPSLQELKNELLKLGLSQQPATPPAPRMGLLTGIAGLVTC